jgi:uncharacterized membrane protein YvbJ
VPLASLEGEEDEKKYLFFSQYQVFYYPVVFYASLQSIMEEKSFVQDIHIYRLIT